LRRTVSAISTIPSQFASPARPLLSVGLVVTTGVVVAGCVGVVLCGVSEIGYDLRSGSSSRVIQYSLLYISMRFSTGLFCSLVR